MREGEPAPTAGLARDADPRREHSRALALQAARALLAEEGWDAITHLRVAERSGLGRATIYRHWPDPAALRRDALSEEVHVFHTTPTGDLRADLLAEMRAIRKELTERGQGRVFATVIGQAQLDPEIARLKAEVVEEGASVLRAIVTDAMARGELRGELELEDAIAMLSGPIVWMVFFADRPLPLRLLEEAVDGLLQAWGAKRAPGR